MIAGTGRFITLEGGDGAGKTTQIKRLVAALKVRGIEAIATREVGGCPSAEEIRDLWLSKPEKFWDPLSEALLIMAARREHLVRTIWPALEKGLYVVSDRFIDSTRVYQGIGLGLGVDVVDALYEKIAGAFWPDVTIYLDLPPSSGAQRLKKRAGPDDRFQQRDESFHEKLRAGFLALAAKEPARMAVVDASQGEDDVARAIERAVFP